MSHPIQLRLRATAVLSLCLALPGGVDSIAGAAEPKLQELQADPVEAVLQGSRAASQIVVTATTAEGQLWDATRDAAYTVADPSVAKVEHGVLHPVANGTTSVTISSGGLSVRLPVTVRVKDVFDTISFLNETIAILTKQCCNGGACLGSP
ncbi:MAG: hypothetical protein N2C14_32380, partial [Planctomycetales bacterium]